MTGDGEARDADHPLPGLPAVLPHRRRAPGAGDAPALQQVRGGLLAGGRDRRAGCRGRGAGPRARADPDPARARPGRVLVATDGADFQSLIGEVLAAAGFTLRQARSGEEAWAAIGSWRPHVALLDVALPGVPAFELCDRVRADNDLQRHRADPDRLGLPADPLQARPDQPLRRRRLHREAPHPRLAPGQGGAAAPRRRGAAAPPAAPARRRRRRRCPAAEKHHALIDEREQETLIREELYGSQGRERKGLERLQERLRRYARIIVSDIALYNQELVERGIREGTFTELLKKEIEEGHRLYLVRVPSSAGGEDYYHEAVRDFIAKRTGAHGGGRPEPRGKA